MDKTIVAEVKTQKVHPLYKKILIRTKKYKVHCDDPEIKTGATVRIIQTRPISREKHYKIMTEKKKR